MFETTCLERHATCGCGGVEPSGLTRQMSTTPFEMRRSGPSQTAHLEG